MEIELSYRYLFAMLHAGAKRRSAKKLKEISIRMSMTSEQSTKFSKRNDDNSNPNHEHSYEDPNGNGADFIGGSSEGAEREVWFRPCGSA